MVPLDSIDLYELREICNIVLRATGCNIALIGSAGDVISSSIDELEGQHFPGTHKILSDALDQLELSIDMPSGVSGVNEACLVPLNADADVVVFVAVIAPLQNAKQHLQLVKEFVVAKLAVTESETCSDPFRQPQKEKADSQQQERSGLKLSEERFRDFANAAADWFWEMGPDLRFTYLSGRVEEVLGVTPDAIIGKTREELHSGANYTKELEWQKHLETISRHEPFTNFVTSWFRPDGEKRFYLISGNPVFDTDGTFQGYRGAGTDITNRRSIERRVAFTQFTVDQAKIAIFWCYSSGKFFYVNNTACDWLQYTRDELSKMHVADINPEFPIEAWPEHWQEIKDKGLVYIESVHQRKNGETYPVGIYSNYVQFEGDEYKLAFVHDITDRKRSEDDAKKAHLLLQGVLDAASQVSVICTDTDGIITVFNSGAEKMLGYSEEEMVGKETPLIIHSREEVEKYGQELSKKYGRKVEGFDVFVTDAINNGFDEREWTYIRKDGSQIQVYLSVTTVNDETGCVGYLGTAIDITDRKHSEAELRRSTQILNDVLNTIPVRVFWKDVDGVFLGCNKLFAKDAGKDRPGELIGLTDFELSWKDHADAYRKDDSDVIKSRQDKINYEEGQTTPDGRSIWLSTSKVPLLNDDGEVYGVLGTYDDITDRKMSEITLQRLQSYLSNIIDSMPSILIGVDMDGVITQWNNEAMLETGVTTPEAIGKSLGEVFPRLGDEKQKIEAAIRYGKAQVELKRPYKSNGQILYEDVTVFPLTANGVEGAVIMVDNVTEQVNLEEMMIQSEKMLSVGGLAAGMAHEINNPLAGMIQTANVMRNRLLNDTLPANVAAAERCGLNMEQIQKFMEERGILRMVEDINGAGGRVADIVNNMLNFARKSDTAVSSHDLEQLIETTIQLAAADYNLKSHYDFKSIEIERDYDASMPPVPCESAKIQQVLLNILRNGAEAMQSAPDSRHLFKVRTWVDSDSSEACIEISDNGPGMDEETRKRVFEPFFTTKPVGVGTGLGLSVSYFIITENHNGEMKVESEPGNGARFTIQLPLAKNGVPE